ncbi:polyphosphate kinase 2, PA0141 family [Spirosomataceae bacterium TFI 002]|nr:polyphosphate kinase 2, PA0141 family [Spirosomataceae bacterium TFI 002]
MIRNTQKINEADLAVLNSQIGQRFLFSNDKLDLDRTLRQTKYELELRELQADLVDLQKWVIDNKKKVVILFEGRDSAGKGGAIRRITAHINPRFYRIVALSKPSEDERGQWFFQRYVQHLPKEGEIVFFDRSWYNRAVVEPVNGFCTPEEYKIFMNEVNYFEKMLIDSGTHLIKFYFSITKLEQARRFKDIQKSPLKKWKMTAVDEAAQGLWDEYTKYKQRMFRKTNLQRSPWVILQANRKTKARIEAIKYILKTIPYKS